MDDTRVTQAHHDLEVIEISPTQDATASLIVLHGLGADGNDFVPVCQMLARDAGLPPMRFLLPTAPTMPVTINNGYRMRAWYDIRGLDAKTREDEDGLRASRLSVEALIANEKARGIPAHRIVLAGFSQGCAMALMTGLRHDETLGGIVGLSGYLPLATATTAERHPANAATPVFLAHGTRDGVVPFSRATASRDVLQALGQPVDWHEYPIEHTVSLEEIEDIGRWLQGRLGAA